MTREGGDGPNRPAGARRHLELARQRVDESREHLVDARRRSKLVDLAFGVAEHDDVTGGGLIAAALAFRIFVMLVPYVFCVVAALGLAAGSSGRSSAEVADDFGIAGLVATGVKGMADASLLTRLGALVVGSIALLLAARAVVKALRLAYGLIWGISPGRLPSATRAACGLVVVITAGLVVARLLAELDQPVGRVVLVALFVALPTGVWLVVSMRFLPHAEDARWSDLLPGAIVTGLGFEVLHIATLLWFSRSIDHKSEVYGALGGAVTILLWAYVLGRVLVLSGEVSAARWFRTHPARGAARGGSRKESLP